MCPPEQFWMSVHRASMSGSGQSQGSLVMCSGENALQIFEVCKLSDQSVTVRSYNI